MEMEPDDVLDVLVQMQTTQRAFFNTIRFFDGQHRTRIVTLFLQNMAMEIGVLREYMRRRQNVTRMVVNLPLTTSDISGNFFDPVVVHPTQEQINQGTERNVPVVDTTCSICQEPVTSATRIRQCGHCFHEACISQWFSMNPRCPMCRADVRETGHRHRIDTFDSLLRALNEHPINEGHRVHADEES